MLIWGASDFNVVGMFQDAFKKLEDKEIGPLLEAVNPHLDTRPFTVKNATVLSYDLSFYPGHRFLEIGDHDVSPPVKRFLIQSKDRIVVLDGTNESFYALNRSVPLRLNEATVVDYVRLFFNCVKGRYGRFIITESVDDVAWREDPPLTARKTISKMITPLCVTGRESDGSYVLSARVMFRDSLFGVRIKVSPQGQVVLSDEELLIEDMPVLDDILGF